MVQIIVTYITADGEYNRDTFAIIEANSESKSDIEKALKEYGLSWELKPPFESHVYVVKEEISL